MKVFHWLQNVILSSGAESSQDVGSEKLLGNVNTLTDVKRLVAHSTV